MASSWDSNAWSGGRSGRLLRAGLSSRAGSNFLQKIVRGTVRGTVPIPLTFTELEPLARAGHAVLLALLGAGIASEQALFLEPRAVVGVHFAQCARDAEADSAR